MMIKRALTISISLLFALIATSHSVYAANPKREVRAVWIASVENIDWPSKSGLSPNQQMEELITMLDKLQEIGINTIIMQIRPYSDALYSSKIEPWSKFLSGKQGIAPKNGYDPFEFVIEQCHKRCMEIHAWFNPYRVGKIGDTNIDPSHISKIRPEWIVTYGKMRVLDPGIPDVREYVTGVIADVVKRYDIDAVHIDDYFYPYKIKGIEFNDKASFAKYSRGFTINKRDDWRRDNVNKIIKMLSDTIHHIKPYVRFGVSPFGIWRNKNSDPRGSNTNGGQNYDDIYADIRLWMQKGWIDYVVPQLYWNIGLKSADYKTLVNWWVNNSYNVPLYIGHGIYKMDPKSTIKEWADGKEISRQLALNRSIPKIEGSIFFSAKTFMNNPLGVNERIKNEFYKYYAIPPRYSNVDSIPPQKPNHITISKQSDDVVLNWECGDISNEEMDKTRYYIVYRSEGDVDINNPANIYTITNDTSIVIPRKSFLKKGKYHFCVTAVDRLNNESEPSDFMSIKF
jgi:Uncharacterized protein conserved in bacteria